MKNRVTIILIIILIFGSLFIYFLLNNKNSSTNNSNNTTIDESQENFTKDDSSNMINDLSKIETISNYNTPIIPIGFKKVETETASWELDENQIPIGWNNGLVIEDDNGNQFVWIPVQDIQNFKRMEGYYENKKQEYIENCQEADYYNQTVESKELYESIKKYQGFYIARYEAGIENFQQANIANGTIKPISKANVSVWHFIHWGSAYGYALDGIQGSDTEDGAVKLARSMYPNTSHLIEYGLPKNLENNTGAISTLCYGIQWDLTIDFIEDIENLYTNTKFIENSSFIGNYEKGLLLTGYSSTKNIYDLAGNAWEWTMESYKNHYRIYRGGKYDMGTSNSPSASMRAHIIPNLDWAGFRVALYIK